MKLIFYLYAQTRFFKISTCVSNIERLFADSEMISTNIISNTASDTINIKKPKQAAPTPIIAPNFKRSDRPCKLQLSPHLKN